MEEQAKLSDQEAAFCTSTPTLVPSRSAWASSSAQAAAQRAAARRTRCTLRKSQSATQENASMIREMWVRCRGTHERDGHWRGSIGSIKEAIQQRTQKQEKKLDTGAG